MTGGRSLSHRRHNRQLTACENTRERAGRWVIASLSRTWNIDFVGLYRPAGVAEKKSRNNSGTVHLVPHRGRIYHDAKLSELSPNLRNK
jgi:hypothetical protein